MPDGAELMLLNDGPLGPLLAASKAALYDEAGANDGIEF